MGKHLIAQGAPKGSLRDQIDFSAKKGGELKLRREVAEQINLDRGEELHK